MSLNGFGNVQCSCGPVLSADLLYGLRPFLTDERLPGLPSCELQPRPVAGGCGIEAVLHPLPGTCKLGDDSHERIGGRREGGLMSASGAHVMK